MRIALLLVLTMAGCAQRQVREYRPDPVEPVGPDVTVVAPNCKITTLPPNHLREKPIWWPENQPFDPNQQIIMPNDGTDGDGMKAAGHAKPKF